MWNANNLKPKLGADSDTSRLILLSIWSLSLLITAGLTKTAIWLSAIGFFFVISQFERRAAQTDLAEKDGGWGELGIIGVWGLGPVLVFLSDHPEKLTIAVIMLVCGFLIILGRYRNSARPAVIVSAPYIILTLWFLYRAFGTDQFTYFSILAVLIFGTFVTMTAFSVRTQQANQTMITEKEKLIADLREARAAADQNAKFKADFLSSMSHEIRTPLAGVIGMAQTIHDQTLEHPTRERSSTIISCGRSLSNLINDILDLAKIEAEGLSISQEAYNLTEELKSVGDLWRIPAEQKGLRFELKIDPATPSGQIGDIHRIKQCLNNLIGNAVKFTESGFVQVFVTGKSHGRHEFLVFSVKDTGPGVAEAFRGDLFSPFKQSGEIAQNKSSGTGLGLSITKELSELMGGGIKYQANPDRGSQFVFWVKTETDQSQSAANIDPSTHDHSGPVFAGRTVLIVDDIEHNIDILQQVIEPLGGRIYAAENGKEAVEKLSSLNIDLIFMDIRMPIMDGVEATQKIRAKHGPKSKTPIIAYSGISAEKGRQYYVHLGMNDHLPKPFTQAQVIDCAQHIRGAVSPLKQSA